MNEEPDHISRPLVLLVDDTLDGRLVCSEYLRYRGYGVATAVDGAQGLEKAFELRPDLILMDLSLPRVSGLEATRRLREDDRTRDIPVIALTAHALKSARESALQAGCDEVITKPCAPPELEIRIRGYLDNAPGGKG